MPEIAVVVGTIALLVGLGLPAVRALMNSFESSGGAKSMISAALSTARAIAAKESRYAGIRFQRDGEGSLYMVFIIHDRGATGLAPGFRAVEGVKPMKLPDSAGVMDPMVRINQTPTEAGAKDTADQPLIDKKDLDDTNRLRDTCTFSIIFSSTGKLVRQDVRVRNRNGVYQPDNGNAAKVSMDRVFNSPINILNGVGAFVQDDYPDLGLGAESSRNRFVIYDKSKFNGCPNAAARFNYLVSLSFTYINAYTGTIVSTD